MLTPMKAIRAKCLDCCCGQANEVRLCPCTDCPLYPYRFGNNPNIRLTEEQRAKRAANLKKASIQQDENRDDDAGEGNYAPDTNGAENPRLEGQ